MALELILASGNNHKAQEFAELFDSDIIEVFPAAAKIEVEENGDSFQANAYLKAWAYYNKYKRPVLADDSGLVVKALPDELGIHSARFGGDGLSDRERTLLLLEKMKNVIRAERSAYFICILCIILSPQEVYFFEGRVEGEIGVQMEGEDGFGYDPVFLPQGLNGKSLAQDPAWKNLHSHRSIAAKFAQNFFKQRQRP